MKEEQKLNPGHSGPRSFFRVFGPLLLLTAAIFFIVGLVDFLGMFAKALDPGNSNMPTKLWCFFVAAPVGFVGMGMTYLGYMGAAARYVSAEVVPVGKDVVNYMVDGTKGSMKTVATALGAGIKEGLSGVDLGSAEPGVRCNKCNAVNDVDAKFCDSCGESVSKEKVCQSCNELNDNDAKFCDNCGKAC